MAELINLKEEINKLKSMQNETIHNSSQ